MFHRRLWLIFAAFALASAAMAIQSFRLTVVRGEELLVEAESRLVSERWTPTVRGRMLDRKGRVIAKDEPSFDILVDYPMITGEWAWTRGARQARRESRAEWSALTGEAREERIRRAAEEHTRALDQMWSDLALILGMERSALEARRGEIRERVQRTAMTVWGRWLEERRDEESKRAPDDRNEVELSDVQRPLAIHVEPHVIARGVDEQVGFDARRLAQKYPGLRVEPAGRRVYPYETARVTLGLDTLPLPLRPVMAVETSDDPAAPPVKHERVVEVTGVATHVLGWMRGVQAEDVRSRPRIDPATGAVDPGHYQSNDRVGATGIESGYESRLRGQRGRRVVRLDKPPDDPESERVIEPVAGQDVTLTIDINLQARVQAVMDPVMGLSVVQPWHHPAQIPLGQPEPMPDGTRLNGAAVVYEIDSGEVLAMVSVPTFPRDLVQTNPDEIFRDKMNTPWVNRAIAKPYPPGSIVKPIMLVGAVTDGVYALTRPIECTGHLLPDRPDRYRCWVYKQFNTTHTSMLGRPLLAPEAMAVSCNIFFYTLGRDLGAERVIKWYDRFGVGSGFGLRIGDEYAGSAGVVPKIETLGPPHAILMGIGQGPVAWTPLHAAEAFAILARGGLHMVPRIVKDEKPRANDLRIDPAALDAAIEGLRLSVNDDAGTGAMLKFPDGTREPIFTKRPGIFVVGKTGTADAPEILGEIRDETRRREILRDGDHSWFVVMVGKEGSRPRYAISVIMEYAGSGGRVSGPICNQIIEALLAEGYL